MNTTTLYVIQFDAGNIDGSKWVDLSSPYHDRAAADKRINALAERNTFMSYRMVQRSITESLLQTFITTRNYEFPESNEKQVIGVSILDKQ